jgi:hypothetical protein
VGEWALAPKRACAEQADAPRGGAFPIPSLAAVHPEHRIWEPSRVRRHTDERWSVPASAKLRPANRADDRRAPRQRPRHPTEWTTKDVFAWVLQQGIPRDIATRFPEEDIEGEQLLDMTREELHEMGIERGHRLRVLRSLRQLRRQLARQLA